MKLNFLLELLGIIIAFILYLKRKDVINFQNKFIQVNQTDSFPLRRRELYVNFIAIALFLFSSISVIKKLFF